MKTRNLSQLEACQRPSSPALHTVRLLSTTQLLEHCQEHGVESFIKHLIPPWIRSSLRTFFHICWLKYCLPAPSIHWSCFLPLGNYVEQGPSLSDNKLPSTFRWSSSIPLSSVFQVVSIFFIHALGVITYKLCANLIFLHRSQSNATLNTWPPNMTMAPQLCSHHARNPSWLWMPFCTLRNIDYSCLKCFGSCIILLVYIKLVYN